jgi:hypothetical protein
MSKATDLSTMDQQPYSRAALIEFCDKWAEINQGQADEGLVYAEWLESDAAKDVPDDEKFGTVESNMRDYGSFSEDAEKYRAIAALLRNGTESAMMAQRMPNVTLQQLLDGRLNGFAFRLVVESLQRFKDWPTADPFVFDFEGVRFSFANPDAAAPRSVAAEQAEPATKRWETFAEAWAAFCGRWPEAGKF